MKKREKDTEERSKNDTFKTGHSQDKDDIINRMLSVMKELSDNNFKVWRYKIEDVILDSSNEDVYNIFKE